MRLMIERKIMNQMARDRFKLQFKPESTVTQSAALDSWTHLRGQTDSKLVMNRNYKRYAYREQYCIVLCTCNFVLLQLAQSTRLVCEYTVHNMLLESSSELYSGEVYRTKKYT